MHKSTLIELLRTFSKEELDRFELFLKSPYFNKAANAVRFFSHIRNYSPGFDHVDLKKEIVWESMFPDKTYNYGSMKNLIWLLTKLALKFVTQEYTETRTMSANSIMIGALMKRGANNLLSQKLNELDKFYTEGSLRGKGAVNSIQFYYDLANIYSDKNLFSLSAQLVTPDEKSILRESTYSVCSILIQMTKNFNNLLVSSYGQNSKKINNPVTLIMKELNSGLMDTLMPVIKNISEREYRILNLFMKVNKAQLNPGVPEYYKEIYKDFEECEELLTLSDLKAVVSCRSVLLSFISDDKINKNTEAMEINKIMIRNKFFESASGQLQAFSYYHYISSAFKLNDFEEIKVFSKKYLYGISGDLTENAQSYTNALLSFGEKKFDECLGNISKLNYNYFLMKIEIRALKAKCLYELNDYLLFENENKALYHFLKNNKSLSPEAHDSLKTNFDMIAKLFRLREKFNRLEYELLKEKIIKSETYRNSWFAEKINYSGFK